MENVTTTTNTSETIQKESTKPSVETVQRVDTTLTRTPSLKEESPTSQAQSNEQQPTTSDNLEPTPNELVNLGRPPYVVDLMKARMAYETFDIKDQVGEIDTFIRDGIEDSRVSYQQTLNGLKQHIKETGDIYNDIEQLRDYVRIQTKVKDILKEKEKFEALDPAEMTKDQLERFLNGTRG